VLVDAPLRAGPATAPAVGGLALLREQRPPEDIVEVSDLSPSGSVAARQAPETSSMTARSAAPEGQSKATPAPKPLPAFSLTSLGQGTDEPPQSRGLPGSERSAGTAPGPGQGTIGKGLPSSRYLSPARLRRAADSTEKTPPASATVSVGIPAPDGVQPPAYGEQLEPVRPGGPASDVNDALFVDLLDIGSYRVQIATSSDFSSPIYDRTIATVDNIDVRWDFEHSLAAEKSGNYWLRMAPVDLLGYQQAYQTARRLRFVGRL
jgi:hypothetical protein